MANGYNIGGPPFGGFFYLWKRGPPEKTIDTVLIRERFDQVACSHVKLKAKALIKPDRSVIAVAGFFYSSTKNHKRKEIKCANISLRNQ